MLGNPGHALDFLYFFIGSFVGGGIVLNGSLYPGRTGNAGALGSLPVPALADPAGRGSQQLIRSASIYVLEQQLLAAGRDPAVLFGGRPTIGATSDRSSTAGSKDGGRALRPRPSRPSR